jgi:endo-1,4-beta-mannosidase
MPDTAITLAPDGYFRRAGERFVPAGVNYWPASCGVEMWARWPEAEIRHDLDVVAGLGLNTVRFFLRRQDLEPEPGRYDETMFARLAQLLGWFRERGLYAQPSLFVGWMSGGVFWPAWREGRNVFADPFLVERGIAFARRAAQVIAPFHDCVAGVDQGNELCCLPDSSQAPPAAVAAWCAAISRGVHEAYPQALVVSGNEQAQVATDSGWRFGQQPGTDFGSMHGYPVPNWHPVGFDGMTDPLCQSLLPFYTQIARAYGPVMLQEFGTIVTFGKAQQESYLHGMLPAAWEAGERLPLVVPARHPGAPSPLPEVRL